MEFYTTKYINEVIKKQYFEFIQKYYSDILKNPNVYIRLTEEKISQYLDGGFVKLLNSGTSALQFALLSLWVWPGDEVILPANTYAGTAIAVKNIAAIPVYADIKLDTFLLDPLDVEKKITSKTKAIIPVHLYGYQCDMSSFKTISWNIPLVEDASHAFGWQIQNQKIGTFGDIGIFSAHQSKNFWTLGNGGIFVTKNKNTFEKLEQYIYPDNGSIEVLKSRRTPANIWAFDALVLYIKLWYIENLRESNLELFFDYKKRCDLFDVDTPYISQGHIPFVRHFTVLSHKKSVLIQEQLSRAFYDIDLNISPVFSWNKSREELKNTSIFFQKNTSLHFYYGVSQKEKDAYFRKLSHILWR